MNIPATLRRAAAPIIALCTLLALGACSESSGDTNEFDNWQSRNEEYFAQVLANAKSAAGTTSSTWKVITSWAINDDVAQDDDHIVVRVLQEGSGSGCPLYTDSVQIHYRGRLIPSNSYPQGYKFDSSYTGDTLNVKTASPTKFAVSFVVDGLATALQNMHIGDHWLVYIPHKLGYGATAQTGIPAYSTLVFEVYLAAYYRAGTPVTAWSAPRAVMMEE